MAIDNEELLGNLQRVAAQMRRSRRASMKHRPIDKEGNERVHDGSHRMHGNGGHHGHGSHGHHMHGAAGMPPVPDGHAPHGYGNHKCHGGSGRHGQNRILAVLVMQDGTSQKDLAYLLGIRPQSLTQALEALEEGGFVERKQDEEDKRINRVYLTDAGRGRAAKVAEDRKQHANDAFSMLTEEEKEQLAAILEKINTTFEEDLAPREE